MKVSPLLRRDMPMELRDRIEVAPSRFGMRFHVPSPRLKNGETRMKAALDQLNAPFKARFESDSETGRTQHS
jgi:hypothetical protein